MMPKCRKIGVTSRQTSPERIRVKPVVEPATLGIERGPP